MKVAQKIIFYINFRSCCSKRNVFRFCWIENHCFFDISYGSAYNNCTRYLKQPVFHFWVSSLAKSASTYPVRISLFPFLYGSPKFTLDVLCKQSSIRFSSLQWTNKSYYVESDCTNVWSAVQHSLHEISKWLTVALLFHNIGTFTSYRIALIHP